MKNAIIFFMLTVCTFTFCSCNEEDPVEPKSEEGHCGTDFEDKGSRLLGMDILDETPTSDFFANFLKAREAGISFIHVHIPWSKIEPQAQVYEDPDGSLTAFNGFVKSNNVLFNLTIRPIDITGKTVPDDLSVMRFSDPVFIERFKKLLDFVFTKMDYKILTNLQVGNEIDGYDTSKEHPDFWSDYKKFLLEINQYLDEVYPGLKMGYTATFKGITSGSLQQQGVFRSLSEVVDVTGVTYYPQNDNFEVLEPGLVTKHLDLLTREFEDKTIYLQEVGYQTSTINKSSEEMQAQFVCQFFSAWDKHQEQIPLVNWVRLHDVSEQLAKDFAGPYGLNTPTFLEYLRTLGLISYDGKEKAAFTMLKEQTKKRSW